MRPLKEGITDTDVKGLVQALADRGALSTSRMQEAFMAIRREDFMPPEHSEYAYADTALPIGHGQTISQPYVVAFMLELLQPQEGDNVLDLGSGSGWTTALLAHLVKPGKVYGVERVPELVKMGHDNLRKYKLRNAEILPAGRRLGLPDRAPFDKILVSAAAEELPTELLEQLAPGGTMVIPVGDSVWKVEKMADGAVRKEEFFGFAFVPLVF